MFVQIHCVHSPLVVETDFILPTPLSNSTMQNHPPESPTSTRPCPKLVLSDGDWEDLLPARTIAVEWVSFTARSVTPVAPPHPTTSSPTLKALCWPLRSRFPHPFARPFARGFCQAAASLIEEDLLPSELFKFLPVPVHRSVFHPVMVKALCHVLPTRGLERLATSRPRCVSRFSTWRSPGSRPCATTSPGCRASPTSGIPTLPSPLSPREFVPWAAIVLCPSLASAFHPRTSLPSRLTWIVVLQVRPHLSHATSPFHAAVHAHAAPSRVANALHGTCCSNRLTQHWTRSRMLNPRYSQRCDHSIFDFVTAPADDKSSKTRQPASLRAPPCCASAWPGATVGKLLATPQTSVACLPRADTMTTPVVHRHRLTTAHAHCTCTWGEVKNMHKWLAGLYITRTDCWQTRNPQPLGWQPGNLLDSRAQWTQNMSIPPRGVSTLPVSQIHRCIGLPKKQNFWPRLRATTPNMTSKMSACCAGARQHQPEDARCLTTTASGPGDAVRDDLGCSQWSKQRHRHEPERVPLGRDSFLARAQTKADASRCLMKRTTARQ